nr:MAG: hypothetical protein DIU52_05405 [bacterium]
MFGPAMLVAWSSAAAATPCCVVAPVERAALSLLGGGRAGFREVGARGAVDAGAFDLGAE